MGSERLSHLPKVTQLVRGAGRVRSGSTQLPKDKMGLITIMDSRVKVVIKSINQTLVT